LVAEKYRIGMDGLPDGVAGPFKRGSRIVFGLLMTNTSSVSLRVVVGHPLKQNRPQLFKDGQVIPYRDETNKILIALEDSQISLPRRTTRVVDVLLEPNKPAMPEQIDMAEWYDPLQAGHYQLNLEHRFGIGQETWINCSPITFEVVP
jgi:hypothetical protein